MTPIFREFTRSIAWRIRAALLAGSIVVLVVAVIQSVFHERITRQTMKIIDGIVPTSLLAMSLMRDLSEIRIALLAHVAGDATARSTHAQKLVELRRHRALATSPALSDTIERLDLYLADSVKRARESVFRRFDPDLPAEIRQSVERLDTDILGPMEQLLRDMVDNALATDDAGNRDNKILHNLIDIERATGDMIVALYAHLAGDRSSVGTFRVSHAHWRARLADLHGHGLEPAMAATAAEIERLSGILVAEVLSISESYRPEDRTDALQTVRFIERTHIDPAMAVLREAIERFREELDEERVEQVTQHDWFSRIITAEAVFFLLLVGLLYFYLNRQILAPILQIHELIARMRSRDSSTAVSFPRRDDEIGAIQSSLEEFRKELLELEALRAEQFETVRSRHHVELCKAYDELKSKEQDLLAHSDRMKRMNAELEQFVSILSHDLREPMKNIVGFCRLLEMDNSGASAETRGYIEKIIVSAGRLSSLIDDLRSLTRLDEQQVSRELRPLNSIISGVVEEHRNALKERDVKLNIGRLATIDCYPNIIWQLFDNLFQNAMRHGAKRLWIKVFERPGTDNDGPVIVFANNRDTSEAAGDDLLLPFRKGQHSGASGVGSGIGLSIVKKAVEMHRGRIWIDCPENGEFSVCFTLKGLSDD